MKAIFSLFVTMKRRVIPAASKPQDLTHYRQLLSKDSNDVVELVLKRFSIFNLQNENSGNFDVTFKFKDDKVCFPFTVKIPSLDDRTFFRTIFEQGSATKRV